MSVMEEAGEAPALPDVGEANPPVAQRVLLVWDAPNLDMGLGSILGGRPTAAHRPRFDALGRWLLARTAELSAARPGITLEPEATVFTNIAAGSADVVRPEACTAVIRLRDDSVDLSALQTVCRLAGTVSGFAIGAGRPVTLDVLDCHGAP